MLRAMTLPRLSLLCCLAWGIAVAEESTPTAPPAADTPDAPAQPPTARDAIPDILAEGKPPRLDAFPGGIRMAVSTPSELAQKHTIQGLNHLHGGW